MSDEYIALVNADTLAGLLSGSFVDAFSSNLAPFSSKQDFGLEVLFRTPVKILTPAWITLERMLGVEGESLLEESFLEAPARPHASSCFAFIVMLGEPLAGGGDDDLFLVRDS